MHVQIHSIAAQQFEEKTIGTQCRMKPHTFIEEVLKPALAGHEAAVMEESDAEPLGQYAIPISAPMASTAFRNGVGARTDNPDDYVKRLWRGRVELFLKREHAVPVKAATLIVYTRAAFLKDPQITAEDMAWLEPETTHVLITCLAAGMIPDQPSCSRWVTNLAGGNSMYDLEHWIERLASEQSFLDSTDPEQCYRNGIRAALEEVVAAAKTVSAYNNGFCVVAD